MPISPIPELVAELAAGRMVILVDEEDRENEGDLVLAAEHDFLVRHRSGQAHAVDGHAAVGVVHEAFEDLGEFADGDGEAGRRSPSRRA